MEYINFYYTDENGNEATRKVPTRIVDENMLYKATSTKLTFWLDDIYDCDYHWPYSPAEDEQAIIAELALRSVWAE
jgi:hypothetical protein